MAEEQKLTKKQLNKVARKAEEPSTSSAVGEEKTKDAEVEAKPMKRNKRKAAEAEEGAQPEEEKKQVKKPKAAAKDEALAKKITFGEGGEVVAEEEVTAPTAEADDAKPQKESKQILFVGNMSFTTTQDEIAKHFGHTCGETPTVRLLTKKADPKALAAMPKSKQKSIAKGKAQDPSAPQSKGCAFLEFKSSAALRKALAFHHTLFAGRTINVELTAGGGGKSENRKQKIKKKNEDLDEERKKMHEKIIAPANKAEKAARGEGGPPKKLRTDGEGEAQWGRRAGKSASGDSRSKTRMPRHMASGPNSVRLAQ